MYWTPRVLSIIFLCFLALFSLDVFEPGLSAGQIALGLLMHNIPVIILGVLLAIAWKYEIVGGIAYNLAGLVYVFFAFTNVPWYMAIAWSIQIAGPAFFIGILFMMNWYKKK
jgi:hypothetical protein